jgi:hypothetical protein
MGHHGLGDTGWETALIPSAPDWSGLLGAAQERCGIGATRRRVAVPMCAAVREWVSAWCGFDERFLVRFVWEC